MKTIRSLIQRCRDWLEVGELLAELQNIKRYGRYYELRKPRVVKRLAELGHPVHASDMPHSSVPFAQANMVSRPLARSQAEYFAERHPDLAEAQRKYFDNFEPEGLTGQWKGKA